LLYRQVRLPMLDGLAGWSFSLRLALLTAQKISCKK
jgi:hypothetical protein